MNKNEQGQFVLDDILTHPESIRSHEYKARYGDVLNFRVPGQLGARFTRNGEFIGFLGPEEASRMPSVDFKLESVSAYDREHLTCEITYQTMTIAEITQETGDLRIELYAPTSGKPWTVPLQDFLKTLDRAKVFLREESGVDQ